MENFKMFFCQKKSFRQWRKLRTLPCSSSPHKAGFAGTPWGSGILPVGQARALCRGLYPLLQATSKGGARYGNLSYAS